MAERDYVKLGSDATVTAWQGPRIGDTWTTIQASGAIPSAEIQPAKSPTKPAVRSLGIAAGYLLVETAFDATVAWMFYKHTAWWCAVVWLIYGGVCANKNIKRFAGLLEADAGSADAH